jgi:hypothetical protein
VCFYQMYEETPLMRTSIVLFSMIGEHQTHLNDSYGAAFDRKIGTVMNVFWQVNAGRLWDRQRHRGNEQVSQRCDLIF